MLGLYFILLATGALAEGPLVSAPAGTFRGRERVSLDGRGYFSFSGIPYAKPPVGNLRFQPPEKADPLSGEFDATKERHDCIQDNRGYHQYEFEAVADKAYVGSEDCLFLNVFTPKVDENAMLPVMVFIHGGAYMFGSGTEMLHGSEIMMDKDIVLVSINYRLGIFGFFSFDGVIPGNLGLKDQTMALRWVKENIKSFGGNPESVTLFGVSAGGASVHQHMVSPLSKGLFHKAISQSGTADGMWAYARKESAQKYVTDFLKKINCEADSTTVLKCLQEKDANEIADIADQLKFYSLDIGFRPVLEEESESAFMTKKSLDEGSSVPWIAGVTDSEGLGFIGELVSQGDTDLANFRKTYKQILAYMLQYAERPDSDKISTKIKDFYVGNEEFSLKTIKELVMMLGDAWFNHALYKSSMKHKAPQFLYLFSYKGKYSLTDSSFTTEEFGANHADEMFYLFHIKKFMPVLEFNEQDRKVSKLIVDLWTNFARDGVPTSEGQNKWPNASDTKKYAVISSKGLTIKKNLFDKRLQFWDKITKMIYSPVKDEL